MKILVTGSTGQLGKAIISQKPEGHQILFPKRNELDLSDILSCKKYIEFNKPDIIINCGAYTNVDLAEKEKELCYAINTSAPVTFAKILNDYGGNLLQISTDYVFDGQKNYAYKENDERNTLFNAVFRLAKKVNPKVIIIENVQGLLTLYKGKAKKDIINLCEELGYNCTPKLLYAPDFGVPQIRKRVFFVALKKELGVFEFPKPTHLPNDYVGCKNAIGDLPDLDKSYGAEEMKYDKKAASYYQKMMREGSNVIKNHIGTKHTKHVVDVISQVPEGGNHKDLPPGVGDSRKFNEAWTRYDSKKPSKTIDTGHRNHFHYKWNRVPTVRENARLQSFPDKFIFSGTKTQQYRQVGNAVPPLLGKILGTQLLNYLLDED